MVIFPTYRWGKGCTRRHLRYKKAHGLLLSLEKDFPGEIQPAAEYRALLSAASGLQWSGMLKPTKVILRIFFFLQPLKEDPAIQNGAVTYLS